MASRGAFGFRSAKQTEKSTEPKERVPVGLSRRSSITSTTSNISKLPMQSTSFFSRSKSKAKVDPATSKIATSSGIPVGRLQDSAKIGSGKSEHGAKGALEPGRSAGLGISTVDQITAAQLPKHGKSTRNVLRRKAPLDQPGKYARTESSASSYELAPSRPSREIASTPETYSGHFAGSVLGITVPAVSTTPDIYAPSSMGPSSELATSSSRMASFNTRKPPQPSTTPNLPQPTPTFVHDSGSSTRRSESPGNFSQTSTPTSMSSQSPGVGTPIKAPLRRQMSPTRSRPPVTRRKFPPEDIIPSQSRGLTAVRESATSSSSSSTIKASDQRREGSQVRSDRSTTHPQSPPTYQSSLRSLRPDEIGSGRETVRDLPEQSSRNAMVTPTSQDALRTGQTDINQLSTFRSPPPRPSREGTPRLDAPLEPSPAIHARLPPLQTSGHRRRQSQEKEIPSAESSSSVSYSGRTAVGRSPSSASSTSVKPSRMPPPNPLVAKPSRAPPDNVSRAPGALPMDTNVRDPRSAKEPSPLSTTSNKTSSRFGLFMKRTKSPLEVGPIESADKAAKKGPAAGTGHEGYAKYSRRGRSGSTSTSASRGRSTSTASAGRTPPSRKSSFTSRDEPMDDFLSARLAPVVIPGGGRAAGSPFHGSSHYPSSSGDSSAAMTSSEYLPLGGLPLSQQPLLTLSTKSSGTHHLRRDYRKLPHRQEYPEYAEQQHKEVADSQQRRPTLAARRSAHRSQVFGLEAEPLKLPAPIDVRARTTSPGMDSRDTVQSSIRTDVSDISEGHEGNWLKPRRTEKRARSPRKWNFFQRAQASPRRHPGAVVPRPDDDQLSVRELPAIVTRVPEARTVPFYALLDGSEQEGLDQTGLSSAAETTQPSADNSAVFQRPEHRLSSLLPSPPTLTAEFPSPPGPLHPTTALCPPEVNRDTEPTPALEPKKPRLQQVGRIPRVVSKRDRPHKPPPHSFSRPFARHPALGADTPASAPVQRAVELERPLLGIQTEGISSEPWGSQGLAKPASAPVQRSGTFIGMGKDEFLSFSPRIGSQVSGVSGSSSSGVLSFAATTAVIPDPGTAPEEDEVWHEYNEFLDTVGSSPAQLSNDSRNAEEKTDQKSRWVPAPLLIAKEPSVTGSPKKIRSYDFSSSSAPTGPLPSPPDRSKLLSADIPSSPGTISDLLAGYGDRNRSSGISQRKSGYTTSRYSTSSIESDADSLAHREGTQGTATQVAATVTPLDQSNLRFNALMTSRWLSFDRVLFSPAHVELDSDRLLVLDGIGNDDWSFYCAETYKDADIFNLSPTPSRPQQQSAALQLPKNHRQIQLTSLGNRFPFPPGFFSAAVLHFPSAATEVAYLNAISECMRVLRPGGYLEMSVLDLDMFNMGNKARKALRELKVRMQVSQPGITLKPLSDNMQKMAKRSGFENLQRTLINIPVAGVVNDSRSNSIDGKSGSLGNLGKEASGKGDGGLAQTLPQVGRWWFTRCYELSSMPYDDTERSIWNDKALLEECERKETRFRLLLCCAQKPAVPTASSDERPKITKLLRTKH